MANQQNIIARGVGRRHKWAIDFTSRPRSERQLQTIADHPAPVGYTDFAYLSIPCHELFLQKCWDIALAPMKQLPMNLFLMYMAGSSISIFPIMMVGMMLWRPIQALMSLKTTYKMLEGSPQALIQKVVYFIANLLGIALALYKCSSMGLLPTHSSDWLSFLEPQQRVEFSGGGMVL
nr:ER membrane protein complex subunit 4-like [Lytechinus pictus]